MKQYDVIIIGAGIAGTSAAAALAEQQRVLVLEQESHPGYHSTGRSAATWAPFYGPPVIQHLTALSGPTLNNPAQSFSTEPFTSPRGQMVFTTKTHAADPAESVAGMTPLSKEQAKDIVDQLRTDVIDEVWYTEKLVNVDVDRLHQAFIRKFKSCSGHIHCNAAVTHLEYRNSVWHVSTGSDSFTAKVIVNAAGAWADSVAELAGGAPLNIQPKRRTAALVPFKENTNMHKWPLIFDASENFYCIPFGGSLLVSPADETPVDAHDAWPDDLDVARGIDRFQNVIDYDISSVEHSWAGLRSFATDGAPVVGFDQQLPGFFWLAGQGGYGIQTSPAMAELATGLIQESFNANSQDYQNIAGQLSPHRFAR